MTYKVLVQKFKSAYNNSASHMIETYGLTDFLEVVKKVEEECNVKSITGGGPSNHCYEFQSEEDFLIFLLKWS
jgi:hypothetical protein